MNRLIQPFVCLAILTLTAMLLWFVQAYPVFAVTEIAPCSAQGQGAGCITPQVLQSSICDNDPGSCQPSTANIVYVACGATLSTYINGSSPSGTVYQLAGNAAIPCTYSSVPLLVTASNITIKGDCSSPIGLNTIVDGGGGNHSFVDGNGDGTTGVTIKCLTVTHFATYAVSCGINSIITNDGWVVAHSSVINGGCNGIRLAGAAKAINNYIGSNKVEGISVGTGTGALTGAASAMLIEGNEIDSNGSTTEVNGSSAGIKIVQAGCAANTALPKQAVVIRSNYVHGTLGTDGATGGSGIWTDCQATNVLIEGNTLVHNALQGLMFEISAGVTAMHNIMIDNGVSSSTAASCAFMSTAANVDFHDNYCALNPSGGAVVGIAIRAGCRSDTPTTTPVFFPNISNIWIHNNTVSIPNAGTVSWVLTANDVTTTADATSSYGNLCTAGFAKVAAANWYTLDHNVYYQQTVGDAAYEAFNCSATGLTFANIQASTGSACMTTTNIPQEVGSRVIAGPSAVNTLYQNIPGCTLSASSGDFCNKHPYPW